MHMDVLKINTINIHRTKRQTETVLMTVFTGSDHYILLKLNACQLREIVMLPTAQYVTTGLRAEELGLERRFNNCCTLYYTVG